MSQDGRNASLSSHTAPLKHKPWVWELCPNFLDSNIQLNSLYCTLSAEKTSKRICAMCYGVDSCHANPVAAAACRSYKGSFAAYKWYSHVQNLCKRVWWITDPIQPSKGKIQLKNRKLGKAAFQQLAWFSRMLWKCISLSPDRKQTGYCRKKKHIQHTTQNCYFKYICI